MIAQSCILEVFGHENDKGFYAVREKSLIAITRDFLDAGCMFGMRALLTGRSGIVLMGIVLRYAFIRYRPHVWRAHG